VSDSGFEFNLNPQDNREISSESGPNKFFEQKEQDLVFQGGRAVKSKVMSNPMFIQTIQHYGVDAAKTIILQELLNMSEEEIIEEIRILASISEGDLDIKRSLRASKFMAIQWLEDEKRSEKVREKCQFIIDTIPTFKISGKVIEKPVREVAPSRQAEASPEEAGGSMDLSYDFELPDIPNRPSPPANPPEPPVSSAAEIKKLARGEKILVITDIQGDYEKLKTILLKFGLITQTTMNNLRWNKNARTKLVIAGDLFNKSPYSTWGGHVAHNAFKVVELMRRLIGEAENDVPSGNIFLCLGNYDLKLASGQLFRDTAYGFSGTYSAVRSQAQALPSLIDYIENTAFDTAENVYSLWEREFTPERELFFKLKPDFQIGGKPEIRIRANEMFLPDITSIRSFLLGLFKELTQPRESRPKSIEELDNKALAFLKEKPGENLKPLANSRERAFLFEGILKGTKTINFLRKIISPAHKFKSEKGEILNFSHVSLQGNIAQMLEKAKETNWQFTEFAEFLTNSKFLKMKKIEPGKLYEDLKNAGFNNLNSFLTMEPEDIFEIFSGKNLLDSFIPSFSPNKLKFGFVKGIERIQEGLKQEDKSGLAGFRLVDRKEEKDFDDEAMKKVAELNNSAKQAYAEKVVTDIFGSSSNFKIAVGEGNELTAEKFPWRLNIEVDNHAALYQDQNKSIHVPIKHVVLISYS
jgi:hypothetical protein